MNKIFNKNNYFFYEVIIVFFFSVLFTLSGFVHFDYLGSSDWDSFSFFTFINIYPILKFHQFPFWNPYMFGGIMNIGDPQNNLLSFMTLFSAIWGIERGLKIYITFMLFIASLGYIILIRILYKTVFDDKILKWDINYSILLFTTLLIASFNGYFFMHAGEGHLHFATTTALLPFFLIAILRKNFILLGLVLSLAFLHANYNFIYFAIIYFIIEFIFNIKKLKQFILFLLKTFFIFFTVSSFKFFPTIITLLKYPRAFEDYKDFLTLKKLYYMFIDKNINSSIFRIDPIKIVTYKGWPEYGYYISIVGVLILIFGIILFLYLLKKENFKFLKYYYFSSFIFLFISLGSIGKFNLWDILHTVPFFNFLRNNQRFLIYFIYLSSIISFFSMVILLNYLKSKIKTKVITFLLFILNFILFIDLLSVNYKAYDSTFLFKKKEILNYIYNPYPFVQVNEIVINYSCYGKNYIGALKNIGIKQSYNPVPYKSYITTIEDKNYKGEIYTNKESFLKFYFSPNKIVLLKIKNLKGDTLYINQNYSKYFRLKINDKIILKPINSNGICAFYIGNYKDKIEKLEIYLNSTRYILIFIINLFMLLIVFYKSVKYFIIIREDYLF